PLAAGSELGLGPLNPLLEAARDAAKSGPVVSRIAIDEAELVGADGVPLPEPWPADADNPPAFDPRVRAEALRGIDALISGLESLTRMLSRPIPAVASSASNNSPARTAAQLVDEVVHTAADGIEDLAAGLMRANELASVAERVTNRATLLALNAALEATRSGSEAFAAIAEETRRLAEFAREATDTISRLASEIEYKVGETITAIHSTSEDAKLAVAALSGSPPPTVTLPPTHLDSVEGLLSRAREVRQTLTAITGPARGGAGSASSSSSSSSSDGSHDDGPHGGSSSSPAESTLQIERASRLEEPMYPGSSNPLDDDVPMREVPPPIEMASDLAPELPHAAPPREDGPAEHMLMLERLKPAPPRYSS
ncbi:MAG: methyl-accepting chemotaxis protein, partial [Candidatus Eiseniibacteriota bacterium]